MSRLSRDPGPKLLMGLVTLYLVAIFCVLVIPLCSFEPDRPASAHYQGTALCVSGPLYFRAFPQVSLARDRVATRHRFRLVPGQLPGNAPR